jgi:hypothetical protein
MNHSALGVDLIDVYAGGHLDTNTANWLGERASTMRSTLSTAANQFFDQAKALYQMIDTSSAIQALRNLTAKTDHAWQSNTIHYLGTVPELQTAGPIMQRWLMAEPTIRKMYLDGEVEGYAGSYVNHHGLNIGGLHYDFRRVMDGVVTHDENSYQHTQYYDDLPEGERELTLHEKADICRSWNTIVAAVETYEEDPTSPGGNLLG